MKSACCWMPMTTTTGSNQKPGHAHRPAPTAIAMMPMVCSTAAAERVSLNRVSGASSSALRMRRAAALPDPARRSPIRRRSSRNSSPERPSNCIASEPDELLAEVTPFQQAEEGFGSCLDALGDRLAVGQFAASHERAELGQSLGPDVHVLADDEALDHQTRLQQKLRLLQRDRMDVVAADHSAQSDAAEGVHAGQCRVEHDAADIFEAAIDAVRRRFLPVSYTHLTLPTKRIV